MNCARASPFLSREPRGQGDRRKRDWAPRQRSSISAVVSTLFMQTNRPLSAIRISLALGSERAARHGQLTHLSRTVTHLGRAAGNWPPGNSPRAAARHRSAAG
jgi:hypothetical protein